MFYWGGGIFNCSYLTLENLILAVIVLALSTSFLNYGARHDLNVPTNRHNLLFIFFKLPLSWSQHWDHVYSADNHTTTTKIVKESNGELSKMRNLWQMHGGRHLHALLTRIEIDLNPAAYILMHMVLAELHWKNICGGWCDVFFLNVSNRTLIKRGIARFWETSRKWRPQ